MPVTMKRRVFPCLEGVELTGDQSLPSSGAGDPYVYFPVDCILSLACELKSGESVETAVVGNEGSFGVSLLPGEQFALLRPMVHHPGTAYRLDTQVLDAELRGERRTRETFLRHTLALFTQVSQTVLCRRRHTPEQQLCRWLLMCVDRLSDDTAGLGQEAIARLLGMSRVTDTLRGLKRRGVVSQHDGAIRVLDRVALEAACCECYAVVRNETERLAPDTPFSVAKSE